MAMPDVSPLREIILIMLGNAVHLPAMVQRGGQIVYANQALLNLFGYTETEILQRSAMDLAAPEERTRVQGFRAKRLNGAVATTSYQCRALRANGQRFEVTVTVCSAPVEDEDILFYVVFQEANQAALMDFATQISWYLHEWSKGFLRMIAANLVQTHWHDLELQLDDLRQQVMALTAKGALAAQSYEFQAQAYEERLTRLEDALATLAKKHQFLTTGVQIQDKNIEARLGALEARRQWLSAKTWQAVKYGGPGIVAIGQEPWVGLGRAVVKWITRVLS